MKFRMSRVALLVFTLVGVNSAFGQGVIGGQNFPTGFGSPSYYYIGPQGGLAIAVNLWGFVKNPGRYEVPSSTDLVQLISYGGGPLEDAQLDKVEIVRQTMQSDSTYKTEVLHVDLQHFQKTGWKPLLLLPGDTVIVPGSTFSALQRVATLIYPFAFILTSIGTFLLVLHSLR